MISMKELLSGNKLEDLPQDHQDNLLELLEKINILRKEYNKPMIVSSGYRSLEHHLEIYAKKGITDKSKIPMASKHLYGVAVDIVTPNNDFQDWCKNNEDFLEEHGFWLEHWRACPTWQHLQIRPYGSYKKGKSIWFMP